MNRICLIIIFILGSIPALWSQPVETTDSITEELKEIIVTAPSSTKLVGSSLVTTIAGTTLQNLGTCLDVLSQLPMITVHDRDVSVTGKGSPQIYIDGRPMRDEEELLHLQSVNIRKIELIFAPGATYDSDTRAVLKIITRRNFIDGLSLTERGEAILRRRLSANDLLDLNYRVGRLDLFATGTVARNNSLVKGSTTNTLEYNGVKTVVGSSQHNTYPSVNGSVKTGFNYSGGEQSFGAYYRFNPERGDYSNHGTEWLDNEPPLSRDIARTIRSHSHLVSTYYDNILGGRYTLHFDGVFRDSRSSEELMTSYPQTESQDVASDSRRNSTLWAGKLYLRSPLLGGEIVTGTQCSFTHTKLDYKMLNEEVEGYIPSSLTDARQNSIALFASWNRNFDHLSLSAGLRYEYVDYLFDVNGIRDENVSRRHNLLTPDLSLSWTFNDETQVGVSYRMSTVKPPYSQLTGSLGYVGRHEIEGGNPALRDERMHDVQIFGMWKGFILQADFTRSMDSYAFVKEVYPSENLQLLLHPVNIDVSAADLYLVWTRNIKTWTPNITAGMHRQWLKIDGTKYNRPIFSYYFENMFTLPKEWIVTFNMCGQSKGDMHTNRFGTTIFTADASVSKSFFSNALQLRLSATDIFNTANNDWTMNTYGIFVDKRQSYDRRGIALSVTYRFNPRRNKYKGESAGDEEMNRL